MVRKKSSRKNLGRKNNGQSYFCKFCNVSVTKTHCHEQSRKHINAIQKTLNMITYHPTHESDDTNTEDTYSNTESDLSHTINTTNENNSWDEDDAYLKTFVCENHFSDESVHERVSKLNTYKVQMKLLKILNDEGACPKLFDIVMEWVNEYHILLFFVWRSTTNRRLKRRLALGIENGAWTRNADKEQRRVCPPLLAALSATTTFSVASLLVASLAPPSSAAARLNDT